MPDFTIFAVLSARKSDFKTLIIFSLSLNIARFFFSFLRKFNLIESLGISSIPYIEFADKLDRVESVEADTDWEDTFFVFWSRIWFS